MISQLIGESVRSQKVIKIESALRNEQARKIFFKMRNEPRGHIIFILDRDIECVPFEALSCLNTQPITRMPCLHCLHDLYQVRYELFYIEGK